jgi:hypothetical protein
VRAAKTIEESHAIFFISLDSSALGELVEPQVFRAVGKCSYAPTPSI